MFWNPAALHGRAQHRNDHDTGNKVSHTTRAREAHGRASALEQRKRIFARKSLFWNLI